MINQLIDAMSDMREKEALRIAEEMLNMASDPIGVLDACRTALEIIGKRFEAGEAFLPELIMAGQMMKKITAMVKPGIKRQTQPKKLGKVMIGTVAGDIHDIGKNMVVFLLDAHGFEVIDLGVNVPPQTFVQKIRESQPDVVGLSALLTVAFDSMRRTVDAIHEAGLRDRVKIMVGGSPVNEQVRAHTGADAWGRDAVAAVALSKQWMGGGK